MTCTQTRAVPASHGADGCRVRGGSAMTHHIHIAKRVLVGFATAAVVLSSSAAAFASAEQPDQVLEWNQIFIDTLIATNTANSSSQRLGAIVQTAVFDAYNGIERRYTPIFVHDRAPGGASRRGGGVAGGPPGPARPFSRRPSVAGAPYAASPA